LSVHPERVPGGRTIDDQPGRKHAIGVAARHERIGAAAPGSARGTTPTQVGSVPGKGKPLPLHTCLYDAVAYWYGGAGQTDPYGVVPLSERIGYYAAPT